MANRKFDRNGRLHYTKNGRYVADVETEIFKDGQDSALQAVGRRTGQGFLTTLMKWVGWNDATRHEEIAPELLRDAEQRRRDKRDVA